MNANELADIVDRWAYKESAEYLTDAATMLRAQQAEIEALKAKMSLNSYDNVKNVAIQLTDEEIVKIHNEIYGWNGMADIKDFARAILRKAQEK